MISQAKLVSIHSFDENQFVFGLSGPGAWLGSRRDPTNPQNWVWADGTDWDYINWGPGRPDYWQGKEDCNYFSEGWGGTTGQWDDAECSIPLASICKKGKTLSVSSTPSSTPTATPAATVSARPSLTDAQLFQDIKGESFY